MKIRKSVIFFAAAAMIFLWGCENRVEYDPEEILVTINTDNWLTGNQGFVIVENRESVAIYSELTKGQQAVLRRGEQISGDRVNIHLLNILKDPFDEVLSWTLYSYYGALPGKNVDLYYVFNPGTMTVQNLKLVGNITFTDVPAFDLVTRSANNPGHSHTLNTLQVPCAMPGHDTYHSGRYFYICLQQGDNAGYKLVPIPDESLAEYEISLSGLNNDMSGYVISKDPINQTDIDIMAHGSAGSIEIFALHDQTLFAGNSIKVFVPDNIPQMSSFSTTYVRNHTIDQMQTSLYRSGTVTSDFSYLDAGLEINHISGSMPSISHNSDGFSHLYTAIDFNGNIGSWNIIHPDAGSLSLPEMPADVLNAVSPGFKLSDQLSAIMSIRVTAIEDSRFQDYDDAVDQILDPESFPEGNYFRLTDRKLFRP